VLRRRDAVSGGQARGEPLDRLTRLVRFGDLLRGNLPHDEAPPAGRLDEPFLLQAAKGVAHRRPADVQAFGQGVHHQAGSGGQRSAQHRRRDPVVRLVGQGPPAGADGFEHPHILFGL
jgi:hypothetical protein